MFYLFVLLLPLVLCQEPSKECTAALEACENDLECSNRLAPLMSACTTGTCQPQCRNAVLNVYQNKLGRSLLKSDASCIPGRDELKTCNLLPTGPVVHCSLARLQCEGDLQCNSKWGVYVSECETDASRGECPEKCNTLLKGTTVTPNGTSLLNCTCTEREDNLCLKLKDELLGACTKPTPPPFVPAKGPATTKTTSEGTPVDSCGALAVLTSLVFAFLFSM